MSLSRPRPDELRAAARAVASTRRSACVTEERLIALQAGALPQAEADEVREHLSVCASCAEIARDARRFLEAMGEHPRARARPRWRRPLAIAAGLTVALTAAWLASRPRREAPAVAVAPPATEAVRTADTWNDLRIVKPPYGPSGDLDDELVFRGGDEPADRPDDFARAMAAYAGDDFAAADRGLAAHLDRRPADRRASFYRGASQLLLGRTKEAAASLGRAAEGEGAVALDARFYLALALLKGGDAKAAAPHLEAVERSASAHRDEARALLARIRTGAVP